MSLDAISSAWKIIPCLKARDIPATAKFYTEDLRFPLSSTHGDMEADGNEKGEGEPTFLSVAVGDKAAANIYYSKWDGGSEEKLPVGEVYIALGTEQIDQYYDALVANGRVKVVHEIGDKPWGYRQFAIEDLDGNKLTFFRFLEGGNPGTE